LPVAPQTAEAALGRGSSPGSTGGTNAAQVALPQSLILRLNMASKTSREQGCPAQSPPPLTNPTL